MPTWNQCSGRNHFRTDVPGKLEPCWSQQCLLIPVPVLWSGAWARSVQSPQRHARPDCLCPKKTRDQKLCQGRATPESSSPSHHSNGTCVSGNASHWNTENANVSLLFRKQLQICHPAEASQYVGQMLWFLLSICRNGSSKKWLTYIGKSPVDLTTCTTRTLFKRKDILFFKFKCYEYSL